MDELKDFLKSRSVVNLSIVLLNILIFAVMEILGNTEDADFMLLHGASYTPFIVEEGKYYLLLTSMFLHFGIEHLFNNMLGLIFLGDILEKKLGKLRYFLIYMAGGLAGNCFSVFMEMRKGDFYVSAGASGAVFAVIGALFWLVLKNRGKLDDISGKRLALMIAFSVFEGYTSIGVDNSAHVGGLIAGFLLCIFLRAGAGKQEN